MQSVLVCVDAIHGHTDLALSPELGDAWRRPTSSGVGPPWVQVCRRKFLSCLGMMSQKCGGLIHKKEPDNIGQLYPLGKFRASKEFSLSVLQFYKQVLTCRLPLSAMLFPPEQFNLICE